MSIGPTLSGADHAAGKAEVAKLSLTYLYPDRWIQAQECYTKRTVVDLMTMTSKRGLNRSVCQYTWNARTFDSHCRTRLAAPLVRVPHAGPQRGDSGGVDVGG